MRILVIEDLPLHQQSAHETLTGHEVTILTTFGEAMKALMSDDPFEYDVVLTDMMMPMSEHQMTRLSPGVFRPEQQVPYGFIIALKAAWRGAKFVAVVTDTDHHKDPVSASLDYIERGFGQENSYDPNFVINGAKAMFVHARLGRLGEKDWGWVLEDLIGSKRYTLKMHSHELG